MLCRFVFFPWVSLLGYLQDEPERKVSPCLSKITYVRPLAGRNSTVTHTCVNFSPIECELGDEKSIDGHHTSPS